MTTQLELTDHIPAFFVTASSPCPVQSTIAAHISAFRLQYRLPCLRRRTRQNEPYLLVPWAGLDYVEQRQAGAAVRRRG